MRKNTKEVFKEYYRQNGIENLARKHIINLSQEPEIALEAIGNKREVLCVKYRLNQKRFICLFLYTITSVNIDQLRANIR